MLSWGRPPPTSRVRGPPRGLAVQRRNPTPGLSQPRLIRVGFPPDLQELRISVEGGARLAAHLESLAEQEEARRVKRVQLPGMAVEQAVGRRSHDARHPSEELDRNVWPLLLERPARELVAPQHLLGALAQTGEALEDLHGLVPAAFLPPGKCTRFGERPVPLHLRGERPRPFLLPEREGDLVGERRQGRRVSGFTQAVLEHCACVDKVVAHERQPERFLRGGQRSLVRLACAPAQLGDLVEAKKRAGEPSPPRLHVRQRAKALTPIVQRPLRRDERSQVSLGAAELSRPPVQLGEGDDRIPLPRESLYYLLQRALCVLELAQRLLRSRDVHAAQRKVWQAFAHQL